MPKQMYALEPGAPKRLEISWGFLWKGFSVAFDGKPIGRLDTKQQLMAGAKFNLPDESVLKAQLVKGQMGVELSLLRNGAPLPGSATDPVQQVNAAAGIIYFIAAMSAGLGILAMLFPIPFLDQLGIGIFSIVTGAIFGGLGYLVRARRSSVALLVAIVLFALDGIASLVTVAQAGNPPPIGGLVARVFFIIFMLRALPALRKLRAS
jgi:hypothetical protein